jgi:hypothetical protein
MIKKEQITAIWQTLLCVWLMVRIIAMCVKISRVYGKEKECRD